MSPAVFADAVADGPRRRPPLDESAFLALYARTSAPLARYLRRLTGNAAVAEDLLQDTYVRLLGQPSVPTDDDHLRHYLFRIATNLARDHGRRVVWQRPLEAAEEPTVPPAAWSGDVWALLARVTARDRELLLLAYVEGLTHREIAAVTGLVRASVRPLLFRARRRFAAQLRIAGLARGGRP
jgi:RNA polymerase sigma-70 factor (ECF subfamily)